MTNRRLIYDIAIFLGAAGALTLEIVAGRLLAPYVGMSLYSWTAIIAVVLAGLSIGHWLGGRLAGSGVDARRGATRLAVALALAAVSSLATLVLIRLLSGPILGGGSSIPTVVALTTLVFLPPSLFAGIVSPLIAKLAIDEAPGATGQVLGRVYALGAVGSIVGTLATGYVFLSWIGSTGTVLAVAATYAVLAAVFATLSRRSIAAVASVLLVGGAGLWLTGEKLQAFASPCDVESDYYCIRVVDFTPETGRPSALLVLDHLGHGINDRDEPRLLYSPYLHLIDEIVRHRFAETPISAFFIGGGAYTLPRAWLQDDRAAEIVVAEIDPAVSRIARDRLWLADSPRLEVQHLDARVALQALPALPRFDVVVGDAFHDISIPQHLVTDEFHREIAARLRPGGFYAINVIESRQGPDFLFSLVRTLRQRFAAVEAWLDLDEYRSSRGRVTYLVLASDTPSHSDRVRSTYGIDRMWLRLPEAELSGVAEALILTDDLAPVDRLLAHILLQPELAE